MYEQEIAEAGITVTEAVAGITAAWNAAGFRGTLVYDAAGVLAATSGRLSRRDEALIDRYFASLPKAVAPSAIAATEAEPMATERQVSYIRSLIRRGAHLEGGYITVTADTDPSKLTRRMASAMIDSLTIRY